MNCTTETKGPHVKGLSFAQLLSDVDGNTRMSFYAMLNGAPIAQVDVTDWERPGGWISWVFVRCDWQRHGVGRALLQHIMEVAGAEGKDGLGLSVKRENVAARALYESLGFRYIYSYDADTYAMSVQIGCAK